MDALATHTLRRPRDTPVSPRVDDAAGQSILPEERRLSHTTVLHRGPPKHTSRPHSMENLLSLAFDNLSSHSITKISKGLRQIEGLLAQICLSPSRNATPSKHHSSADSKPCCPFEDLPHDPAYREFYKLQHSFAWNIPTRLLSTLELLLSRPSSAQTSETLTATLTTLHGLLLLHPPSRTLFSRPNTLTALLSLLSPHQPPSTATATLLVLSTALLETPHTARAFESADGLRTVCALLHSNTTSPVRHAAAEFLHLYLLPEHHTSASPPTSTRSHPPRMTLASSFDSGFASPSGALVSSPLTLTPASSRTPSFDTGTPGRQRSQGQLATMTPGRERRSGSKRSEGSGRSWSSDGDVVDVTRSTEEKVVFLRGYLDDVEDVMRAELDGAEMEIEMERGAGGDALVS